MANAAKVFKIKKNKAKKLNERPNSYRRGYGGKRWEYIRKRVFLRDNYICQICGELCIEGSSDPKLRPHCDHIIPKPVGKDTIDNCQTTCGSCHSKKTAKERKSGF